MSLIRFDPVNPRAPMRATLRGVVRVGVVEGEEVANERREEEEEEEGARRGEGEGKETRVRRAMGVTSEEEEATKDLRRVERGAMARRANMAEEGEGRERVNVRGEGREKESSR